MTSSPFLARGHRVTVRAMRNHLVVVALSIAAASGCSFGSTATSSPPPQTAPVSPGAPAGGTVTSQLPGGFSCAVVAVEPGKTIITDEQLKVGSICADNGRANAITSRKCKDGTTIADAADQFWWISGQPVQAGRPPAAVVNAC